MITSNRLSNRPTTNFYRAKPLQLPPSQELALELVATLRPRLIAAVLEYWVEMEEDSAVMEVQMMMVLPILELRRSYLLLISKTTLKCIKK